MGYLQNGAKLRTQRAGTAKKVCNGAVGAFLFLFGGRGAKGGIRLGPHSEVIGVVVVGFARTGDGHNHRQSATFARAYGCSTVVLIGFTCPAITVGTSYNYGFFWTLKFIIY